MCISVIRKAGFRTHSKYFPITWRMGQTEKGVKSNDHSGCQQRRNKLWLMKVCLCYCFTILTTILELPELLRSFSCKMGGGLFCLLSWFYRETCFTLSVISHLFLPPCSFPQQFRVPNMLMRSYTSKPTTCFNCQKYKHWQRHNGPKTLSRWTLLIFFSKADQRVQVKHHLVFV